MTNQEVLERIWTAAREKSKRLDLSYRKLKSLPPEIGKLTNLQKLELQNNQLSSLPPELGQLTNLTDLYLYNNQLSSLPPELGQLTNLEWLNLQNNQLSSLPVEISQLTNLEWLALPNNQLSSLPPELGQLTNLRKLYLNNNQLSSLPSELGNLKKLEWIAVNANPLTSPPPEIVQQGTGAILSYLRKILEDKEQEQEVEQWVAKLVVVGEGGVGKTCLLHRLREEEYDQDEVKTRGFELSKLLLPHPTRSDVTLQLNTWDFGGQKEYHATHQYFLTDQCLVLLVWNSRLGYEQSKLTYWLDVIKARAPKAPVIIVAAHMDEHLSDLPINRLKEHYPQIADHFYVSNAEPPEGIGEVREAIRRVAADPERMPSMGQPWPSAWLKAAETVQSDSRNWCTPKDFRAQLKQSGVEEDKQNIVADAMHIRGEILWYRNDSTIDDIVILKPHWVSKYISRIIDDPEVIDSNGLLTAPRMNTIWSDLSAELRPFFVRVMERFDLSYQTLDDRTISLVVERLRYNPQVDYESEWEAALGEGKHKEVSMKFGINAHFPPGIPTYFLARFHRHSRSRAHVWLRGGLFTDGGEHRGLLISEPEKRFLRLAVRGPLPHNFFVRMRDSFEETLKLSRGLYPEIERTIPCPGNKDGKPCPYEFDLFLLEERASDPEPRLTIECPKCYKKVSVPGLLFGLHWTADGEVMKELKKMQAADDKRHHELVDLIQREFVGYFQSEMEFEQAKLDASCPSLFTLVPAEQWKVKEKLLGKKLLLHLWCQAPGEWHPTPVRGQSPCGEWEIDCTPEWAEAVLPFVQKAAPILKRTVSTVARAVWASIPLMTGNVATYFDAGNASAQIGLMESVVGALTDIRGSEFEDYKGHIRERGEGEPASGYELRVLRSLLEKLDPPCVWGGLRPVINREDNRVYWLCEHHAQKLLGEDNKKDEEKDS